MGLGFIFREQKKNIFFTGQDFHLKQKKTTVLNGCEVNLEKKNEKNVRSAL